MATEQVRESRLGRILGGVVVVIVLALIISGCNNQLRKSFPAKQGSVQQVQVAEENLQQVEGVKKEEQRIYENSMCGVEFEYPEEWEYRADEETLFHADWGKVKFKCEDVKTIAASEEKMEVDRIWGMVETKANYKKVVVNLPGGELEWIMEGEAKAVEEIAKLVEFVRMPKR